MIYLRSVSQDGLSINLSILIQGKGICNSFILPPFNLSVAAQNYLAVSHG